jgi:acetolactate synthase-1/2/3 large subunit
MQLIQEVPDVDGPTGGVLVVRTLTALGADTVFGQPGQHALALFAALARSPLRYVGSRTEPAAAFAADGYARERRNVPGVVFLSTGPGALLSLSALQESRAACVPVVAIVSQVPSGGVTGARQGLLHELPDQAATAAGVVKHAVRVTDATELAAAVTEAWHRALTAPCGPCWVEIPQDLLDAPAPSTQADPGAPPTAPKADPGVLAEVVDLLDRASRPVIIAGGGVQRAGAEAALYELATRLRAPVAQTFGAKGVFPWDHPLSLQSWLEDRHITDFLESADVVLAVGTRLGELTTNYRTFCPGGRVIHIDADPARIGANYDSLGVVADCGAVLPVLAERVTARVVDGTAEGDVASVLAGVAERLDGQPVRDERAMIAAIRSALRAGGSSYWDMTILGYWAWSAWPESRSGAMQSAQGAGGLGFALPAALGAAVASGRRVLAVSGDGGAMYGLGELAALRQAGIPVTWLIVDDGGYGILREYMTDRFGTSHGTELARPDFAALAAAFGVPSRTATVSDLEPVLRAALTEEGPNVVVLTARPAMFAPTHRGTAHD